MNILFILAAAVLNAANEMAVAAFLDERIQFLHIAEIVEQTLNTVQNGDADSIETILQTDLIARKIATEHIAKWGTN